VLVDFALISGAFAAAYAIRFGWPGTVYQRHIAEVTIPIVIAARYLAFIPFGLYRSIWRYAGSRDLFAIGAAVVVSEVAGLAYISLNYPFGDFSRSFFVIDALICAAVIAASRFAERLVIGGARGLRDRAGAR
jgi:UDP-GlcNAc:undecaprenyl-phosphate GlcNAc-1-phosphate transferase